VEDEWRSRRGGGVSLGGRKQQRERKGRESEKEHVRDAGSVIQKREHEREREREKIR